MALMTKVNRVSGPILQRDDGDVSPIADLDINDVGDVCRTCPIDHNGCLRVGLHINNHVCKCCRGGIAAYTLNPHWLVELGISRNSDNSGGFGAIDAQGGCSIRRSTEQDSLSIR